MFDWSPCWGWRKSEFMGSRRRRKSRIDDLRNPKLALRIFFFWFSDSLWASIILQQLGHCCKIMNVSRPKYGRDVHNFVQFCISGTTHCANCSNDRQSVQSRIAISNRISIELDYVEFVLSSTQLQNAKENRKSGWHKKKVYSLETWTLLLFLTNSTSTKRRYRNSINASNNQIT